VKYRPTIRDLLLAMGLVGLACAGWAWWTRRPAPGQPVLQGQVKVRGRPVSGSITLIPRDPGGHPATAAIADGQFLLRGLAGRDMSGTYGVTIVGEGVPVQYGDPATSPLSVDLMPRMLTAVAFDLAE
jgi:hypothetical protein